jgi:hypothetical protein
MIFERRQSLLSWTCCIVLVETVLGGCSDRSAQHDTGDGTGTTTSSTSTSSSFESSSTSVDASTSSLSSEADTSTASTGTPSIPVPECRGNSMSPPQPQLDDCAGRYGNTLQEQWEATACTVCWCSQACTMDSDCFDAGTAAVPRCVEANPGDPGELTCWLICEEDSDCPPETRCLDDELLNVRACWVVWPKPECCDQGGPHCD